MTREDMIESHESGKQYPIGTVVQSKATKSICIVIGYHTKRSLLYNMTVPKCLTLLAKKANPLRFEGATISDFPDLFDMIYKSKNVDDTLLYLKLRYNVDLLNYGISTNEEGQLTLTWDRLVDH